MGWKRAKMPVNLQNLQDSMFLSLEEIDESDLRAETRNAPVEDEEDVDWSSFIPLDEFKEKSDETKSNNMENKKPKFVADGEAVEAWGQFGLEESLVNRLSEMGYNKPTPIQANTLMHSVSRHRDIIGAAETVSCVFS